MPLFNTDKTCATKLCILNLLCGRPFASINRVTLLFTRTWLAQDPDLFDAAHFRLSRTEAVALDPQARLLLQVSAEVSFPDLCSTPLILYFIPLSP